MLKKVAKVLEYELPIKIESQKEGGFVVTCPIWPDCYAKGETIDEAVLEITAVTQSLIELYKEEDLKIPLRFQPPKAVTSSTLSVPVMVSA